MTMTTSNEISKLYAATYDFNEISGNFTYTNTKAAKVDLQLSLIFEKLQETITAFENGNDVEILDGAVDVAVTAFGLLQHLNEQGYDVDTAMQRVAANNLSKFTPVGERVGYDPETQVVEFNSEYQVSVLRNKATGKVMKPANFPPVDLSDLTPVED